MARLGASMRRGFCDGGRPTAIDESAKPAFAKTPGTSALGRFETFPWLAARSPTYGLAQIAPVDLYIPVPGQLASAELPLGDALEAGPLWAAGTPQVSERSSDAKHGGDASVRRHGVEPFGRVIFSSPPLIQVRQAGA